MTSFRAWAMSRAPLLSSLLILAALLAILVVFSLLRP